MKNYPRIFLIILGLITSFSAFSTGGDVSGGGNIVVCNEGTPAESYELLDYFEARYTLRGFELDDLTSYSGSDVYEKAISIFEKRLKKQSPYILDELTKVVHDFRDFDIKFLDRSIIVDIDDSNTSVDPAGNCFKKQIAVQFKNPSSYVYRVLIDQAMWNKIDEATKIGLILHEALYKVALDQGHKNSNKVRYLNSALSNKDETGRLPYTTELSEHFQFAEIETCWDLSVFYMDEEQNHKYLKLPVFVSSIFTKNKEVRGVQVKRKSFGGTVCKDYKVTNTFVNDDLITVYKGDKVIIAGDALKPSKYETAYTLQVKSNDNFFKAMYEKPKRIDEPRSSSNHKTYTDYFNISLKYPFNLLMANKAYESDNSYTYFPHLHDNLVYIENCHLQLYHLGVLTGCYEVDGFLELFGNELDIKEVNYSVGTETGAITRVVFDGKISNGPFYLNNFLNVLILQEKSFHLIYTGLRKTITVEKRDIEIQKMDIFYFDLNSKLIDIQRDDVSILK